MKECVIIPAYRRQPWLYCCIKRIREQDPKIPIYVFSDRGEPVPFLHVYRDELKAKLIVQPIHHFHGNSWNAGTALRFAYNMGYELITYIEEDTMAKPDLLAWTREMHSELDESMNIFCTCGWVFNYHMPFCDDNYLVPWIYFPQFSITRQKLELLLPHLNYEYFADMDKYLMENFPENALNKLYPQCCHTEIDGLAQRVLMQSRTQVCWCATPKVRHCGPVGYNRGWEGMDAFFEGCPSFEDKVDRVEAFIADPYWRATMMEKSHVEREEGRKLDDRMFHYKLSFDGWSTEFESSLDRRRLPKRIHSVDVPAHAEVQLIT